MTPLIRATMAFAAGIVAGLLAPGAVVWPLLGAGALLAGMLALGRTRAAVALFLVLGGAAGAVAADASRTSCAAQWRQDQRVGLRGHLLGAPVPGRAVPFQPVEAACREPLRVSLPRRQPPPAAGEPVLVEGSWQPFPASGRWPVAPLRAGILQVRRVAPDARGEASRLVAGRAWAQQALRRTLPRRHAVAEALVLARNEALETELRDTFAAAGLSHLLAISGAHVIIFAGVVLLLLRLAHVPLRGARVAALLLVGAYVAGVGAPPAAARAALQFALVMAAMLLQRPSHAWTLMAAAALALLVLDPLNALDIGFQLSFAGVAGLLAWRRRIMEALPTRLPVFVRDGLGSGLAATITTAPIAAWHFGQFAPIGLPATIVASPVIALALPGIALLLLVEAAAPALSPWLAPGLELLLGVFLAIARAAAAVPLGHVRVAASSLTGLLLAAAGVLLWQARARGRGDRRPPASPVEAGRRRRIRALGTVQALAAAALLLSWAPRFAPDSGQLELHLIDVGQGDAVALRTPHGRWILVDAGDRNDRIDMGQRRVVPYLLRRGVRRIDLLLLTHPHADHIGGAVSVFDALDVGAVGDPGAAAPGRQYLETLQAAASERARWIAPRAGDLLVLDGVQLRFLHPAGPLLDAPDDANDISLVLRVGFGSFHALLLGDAPQAVEERLVANHGRELAAAVLKVGHHGSITATAPALLEAVAPRLALVSVGRDNRYGHPAPAVLERLVRHGVRVLRTDEHGSVVVRAWRSGRIQLGTER